MTFQQHASLKPFNTFGIPATADRLGRFSNVDELRGLLASPEVKGAPLLILGGGSNILFTQDFHGTVLLNEIPGMVVVRENEDHVWVRAGAGVTWHSFVLHCVANGWGGVENLSMIPGKVGAAPMQNIGAYGVEIKDTFDTLEALRIADGEVISFDKEACAFGYRESFFKRAGKERYVILNVTFRLSKRPVLNTSYGNIQQELERMGIAQPTLRDVSDAVIAIRRSKLPDPAVIGNAGSFFKNPVVPQEVADRIKAEHPDTVSYPAGPGLAKLAAGWLIERAGLKGYSLGTHGVHDRQALVLVNRGGANGHEVYALSEHVLRTVKEKFGVELEREVNIL
ncbi:MAG: UDP-N-acetylmuramate dehydrogenase [Flavobacteriales bacterium]|nr:UDP-N-acetylmuramate dehydrogenase [Flavobacteriales bacterium]